MEAMTTARLRCAPFCSAPHPRSATIFCCSAASARNGVPASSSISRRDALLGGLAVVPAIQVLLTAPTQAAESAPGKTKISVQNLNSFQRNAEKAAFLRVVEGELKKDLKPEDAPDALRLVLHDAGTYDVNTETGGINGSIILEFGSLSDISLHKEELSRPENQSLKPYVDRLRKIKTEIDKQTTAGGYGIISWADLEVLAAKWANEAEWRRIKIAGGLPSSGEIISSAFGASWPVKLGRLDTDRPDPSGRLPPQDASVAQITEFFARLNNRSFGGTGFFTPRPIFDQRQAFLLYGSSQQDVQAAEAKLAAEPETQYKKLRNKYQQSRETVTRTDYEVDLIDYFNQLAVLGAKFNPDAYLVPIEMDQPRY